MPDSRKLARMHEHWLNRWREGRIGWHEADGNRALKRHWRLRTGRVLVPLCGKSADLLWLAEQGCEVTGVELSELAARAFFEENDLEFQVFDSRDFRADALPIRIVCGDYFEFADDAGFDGLFDRGALVALPRSLRADYVAHTRTLVNASAEALVVCVDYEQSVVDGPPYSVDAEELAQLWPELDCAERYDDLANGPPKFRDAGLTEMHESVWSGSITRAAR